MAEIKLTRPTGYRVDRGREYRVDIDRKKVGSIRIGESQIFTVPPGRHTLQLKQDWGASEKLQVDLGDNDQAQFACAPRIKENDVSMIVGLRAIYWTTIGCRRYIDLRRGDQIADPSEPKRVLCGLDGPKLFAISLVIGIAWWVLTGQDIVAMGVVVAAMAIVVSGLIARGISKAAVRTSKSVQKRRRR
ncbi:MAG TPA: hypothetical protein VH703_00890 [Solirubrobacterales bacterium]|jgi:hypothetical protein